MTKMDRLLSLRKKTNQRDVGKIDQYRLAFEDDLEIDPDSEKNEILNSDAVRDFLIDVCDNIHWYGAELRRRLGIRRLHF